MLASNFSTEAKLSYASNPLAPPGLLDMLALDDAWVVRRKVAGNPNISLVTQGLLARDPYPEVRSELALNPNLSAQVAHILAKDPEPLVRLALVRNEVVPPETLHALLRDPFAPVREAIASRKRLSHEVASALAKDPSMTVLVRLLQNPSCPAQVAAEVILGFPEARALELIEMAKPLPVSVQESLAARGGTLIRSHLASVPWVDRQVWEKLRQDPEEFVRQATLKNPMYKEESDSERNSSSTTELR